jgi:UDPglucose 6-dehydrogenase
LQALGHSVVAYDPAGYEESAKHLRNVGYAENPYQACAGADAAILVTEWGVFRTLDLARLASEMQSPVFLDFRNVYDPVQAAAAGLRYHSIGRAPTGPGAADRRTNDRRLGSGTEA